MLLAHNEANLNDPQLKSIFRVVKSLQCSVGGLGGSLGPSSLKWKGQTDSWWSNLNIPDLARIAQKQSWSAPSGPPNTVMQ